MSKNLINRILNADLQKLPAEVIAGTARTLHGLCRHYCGKISGALTSTHAIVASLGLTIAAVGVAGGSMAARRQAEEEAARSQLDIAIAKLNADTNKLNAKHDAVLAKTALAHARQLLQILLLENERRSGPQGVGQPSKAAAYKMQDLRANDDATYNQPAGVKDDFQETLAANAIYAEQSPLSRRFVLERLGRLIEQLERMLNE